MRQGHREAMMIARVPSPALSDLQPGLRLAGPARSLAGLQERRAPGAAARGCRAGPHPAHRATESTIRRVLKTLKIPPAPERHTDTSWRQFLYAQASTMVPTDF